MLTTNLEPVDHRQVMRTVGMAVMAGTAVALGIMLLLFGVRADLNATSAVIFLLLKLAFTMALVIPASIYLLKLARPGGERKTSMALVAAPFVAIILLAAISLAFAPLSYWDDMIVGGRFPLGAESTHGSSPAIMMRRKNSQQGFSMNIREIPLLRCPRHGAT